MRPERLENAPRDSGPSVQMTQEFRKTFLDPVAVSFTGRDGTDAAPGRQS